MICLVKKNLTLTDFEKNGFPKEEKGPILQYQFWGQLHPTYALAFKDSQDTRTLKFR